MFVSRASSRGFTLVEMMIVLLIIGILTSFSFPSFSKIQLKAKETALKQLCHTVQLALESYYMDKGLYPSAETFSDLQEQLLSSRSLDNSLINPFTGSLFSQDDSSGRVLYQYHAKLGRYTLEGYGYQNEAMVFSSDGL